MVLALEQAGIGRGEMARQMGTTTEAIRRWTQGITEPKRYVLIAWATICAVDLSWLETGVYAMRDLNPQPADCRRVAPRFRLIPGPPIPAPSTRPRPPLFLAWSVKPGFTAVRRTA